MFKTLADILSHKKSQSSKSYSFKSFKYQDSFDFLMLIQSWEDIIGPGLSKHTYPLKIQNGSLTIMTKHPTYSQELSFLSEDIKKKIFSIYPNLKKHIERLNFKHSSHFFENIDLVEHNLKEHKEQRKTEEHKFNPKFRELHQRASQEFSHIEDPEIKELMISLFIQKNR